MTDKKSNTAKMFTRGGQITFNNIRMLLQINQKVAHWTILLIIVMSVFIVWLITPWSTIQGTYYFYLSTLLSKFGYLHHAYEFIWRGKEIHVNILGVLTEPWFKAQTTLFFHDLKISFYMSSGVSIILMIWIS